MFTQLNGRKLWYDGSVSVEAEDLLSRLKLGSSVKGVFVEKMTPEIEKFNRLMPKEKRIVAREKADIHHNFTWNVPQTYLELNVIEYVIEKFNKLADKEKLTSIQRAERLERLASELNLYFSYSLMDVLSVMIYIIDTFKAENIVWGVGRGSSVSSYVLYVLEVHDIDSVKFNLDIEDFLKPNKYPTNHMEKENG